MEGDLGDAAALGRLVEGADAVLHVAAVYRTAGHPDCVLPRRQRRRAPSACWRPRRAPACARFVHTSTVGVHGHVERPARRRDVALRARRHLPARRRPRPKRWPSSSTAAAGCPWRWCGRRRSTAPARRGCSSCSAPSRAAATRSWAPARPFYHPVYIDDLRGRLPARARARRRRPGQAFIVAGPRYVSQAELAAISRASHRRARAAVPRPGLAAAAGRARCARRSASRSASSRPCTAGAWTSG